MFYCFTVYIAYKMLPVVVEVSSNVYLFDSKVFKNASNTSNKVNILTHCTVYNVYVYSFA